MKTVSIRWRITLWNTAAFAVVLAGFGFLVYTLLKQTHYDQVDRGLRNRFQEIRGDQELAANPEQRFRYWVRKFGKHIEMSGEVWDKNGNVIAQAEQLAATPRLAVPSRVSSDPRFDSLALSGLGEVRRLTAEVPTDQGTFTLMLLAELEHVHEELDLVIQALLLTVPITLGIAAALAYWLAYKALAPVEELRRLTDDITAERLDRRLPIPNPGDELGHLAQTINSMIARLEHSFDEVRRFTGDASHELRTPIAVIRSEAEMGADSSRNLDEARHRFQSILEECSRLTSATSQLLTLSREDAGVNQAAREPVSLQPLIRESVESLEPLVSAKQQEIEAELNCEVLVLGDAVRLRQVFHNLIDNAIKYTPPAGKIRITLTRSDSDALITVSDNGIGIDAQHLPHVFDRFYRVNKNNTAEEGGAGLGLSIVQSIVTAFGGRVDLTSTLGEGSEFRVSLPVAPEERRPQEARNIRGV